MSNVTVIWLDNAHKLLMFAFKQNFSVGDYKVAVDKSRKMVRVSSTKRFHVIADVSQITLIPALTISMMKSEYLQPEEAFSGVTMFIGAPMFIRYTVSAFSKVFYPNQFYLYETLLPNSQLLQIAEQISN